MSLLKFLVKFFGMFLYEIVENSVKLFMPKKFKKVDGKLALITGGGQGLGKALSARLAEEGCDIAICDINLTTSQATCEEIKNKFNVKAEAFKCDVRDTAQVLKLRNDIEAKFGRHVNILVNNAGILAPLGVLEGKNEDIQRVIDINLTAHFWLVRTFLPKMIELKDGDILGIASAAAKSVSPFSAAYTASKFGVNGFYKCLREDLVMNNYDEFINVTVALPGFIDTREDLVDFLKSMNDVFQRLKPAQAADIIIKAMLTNTREIFFPFQYKFNVFLELILPQKTAKILKIAIAGKNLRNEEHRMEMARK